jgi:hypothetical protein
MSMADPTMVLMRSRRVLLGVVAGAAAVAGLLLSGAASAQMPNVNIIPELESKTPEQIEKDKITEKAYKDSLRKIPDAKASSDPWGDVRSAEPARTSAKQKNRTGNAAL